MTDQHPVPTSPSTPSEPQHPPTPPPPASPLDRAFLTRSEGAGRVAFVRHGQQRWPTAPNPPRSEWIDPPLSDTGREQAQAVAEALSSPQLDAVYCSNLQRAHETAVAIGSAHGVAPVVLPELREIELYRDLPEGVSVSDVLPEHIRRGVQERFVRERRWDVFPYSETSAEFHHRIVTSVEGILSGHEGDRVAVVCHGGVINAYLGHLLGVKAEMFFRPGHASVSRVLVGEGLRVLHTLNETHHLAAVRADLVTF